MIGHATVPMNAKRVLVVSYPAITAVVLVDAFCSHKTMWLFEVAPMASGTST